jgi:endonuclease/exonuclease/phosphatase family metal-dependent hydrolase
VRKITDTLILVLNLLAAIGLLVAYLAPFVNPAKLFFPAFFGLGYPYLLMVNLIFLCYWIIRLKKEVLISLVVILAGWNHLNNLVPLSRGNRHLPDEATSSRIFRVMSYNVQGFGLYRWGHDPVKRNSILAFIEEQKPDIVCFQEYYTSPARGESNAFISSQLKHLPENAVYFTSDYNNRNGFGIATFSRFPIIKQSRIPFAGSINAAMYTDMLILEDTVRVFNIHLQSIRFQKDHYAFMDTIRFKYSADQMREIRRIGSRLRTAFSMRAEQASMIYGYIRDSPYPVIVMGDFNDTPQSYAYRKIHRGLHDAFRKSGRGFGNTYAGELPSFRIDHIMYSDPMIPFQFKRVKTNDSDHFPITTILYLPVNTKDHFSNEKN